jgi:hypothetical protein
MSLQKKLGINEYYCPLIDYPNYAVSNYGNVKNRNNGRLKKPYINNMGYFVVDLYIDNKRYHKFIHKLVLTTFEANPENKKCIDHIDNNRLNNELFNLRYATNQENSFNSIIRRDNISGTKGISFHKQTNKWRARISINNKEISLGLFDNIEDAKKARQEKAKELFGVFMNSCEK